MPPISILFVDDDFDELYLFNEALEHAGFNITLSHANDGNELMSSLQSTALPDMVIMDMNMPHKDGLEALTEIRSQDTFKNLPVLIYSVTKNLDSINACYEKGANLFIIKPNNFDGMLTVVKKIVQMNWKENAKPTRENFVITED